MFQIQLRDPNIFVATVDGYPFIDDIKPMMMKKNIKKHI
jgi:cobalamin biosynthesis Co2+ chelatase CbiK